MSRNSHSESKPSSPKKIERKATEADALAFHASGRPGKIEIIATKPMATQRDLALAYSPGVAAPCLKIAENPDAAYDYTAKGNLVAVISNGTAVLGLGDLGALGGKPVMEGKAVLFKRFADVDSIDLEVDTKDVDEFINCVRYLAPTFGGINLEDIKAPECFIIEQRLRELMPIPVFHDDQHGTAIVATAALINAAHLSGRKLSELTMVVNGAGAAAVACVELFKASGVKHENIIMCDTKGVIYQGRTEGMNQWKSAHAVKTKLRTLEEAMKGVDVFCGLSAKGAVTPEMVKNMAEKPIIMAMANPDPEITPEEVKAIRNDAIVATGRSDYPNQVNNVLGFPYIFRGALDVRATTINEEMKVAAAQALADLAREDVPDEVDRAYAGRRLRFGQEYILPVPFDPRLITTVPVAVAQAAMDSGVAKRPIHDLSAYRHELRARLDPTADSLQLIFERVRGKGKRIVFTEGEDERIIRAALAFRAAGYGEPILIGRLERVAEVVKAAGLPEDHGLTIENARISPNSENYAQAFYQRMQRKGFLYRDCQRLINNDRNTFASIIVQQGDADGLITGITRSFSRCLAEVNRVIPTQQDTLLFGLSIAIMRGRTVFISDTAVNELPTPEELVEITIRSAETARKLGHEPRVALLSFSTFGQPNRERATRIREVIELLDQRRIDFEYDGEMAPDVALDYELMKKQYPFCRLTGPANVLVMPALHAASISAKLLEKMGGTVIGPLVMGLSKPAQFLSMDDTVSDIVTAAALAAHESLRSK